MIPVDELVVHVRAISRDAVILEHDSPRHGRRYATGVFVDFSQVITAREIVRRHRYHLRFTRRR